MNKSRLKLLSAITVTALISLSALTLAQGEHPSWAQVPMEPPRGSMSALPMGPKPLTDVLHISLSLPYRNPEGMQAFVNSVSDPKNPNYRHFLTPKEIGTRYGPSQATINQVTNYLKSHGINVRLVGDNHLSVLADATVAQAQAAFNTSITEYLPLNRGLSIGPRRFSFTAPPNLPSTLRGCVFHIGGLEDFTQPQSRYQLTPSQLRTLYSIAAGYNANFRGQGRTVAISNFVGYRLSNVALEYSHFGLPTPAGGVGTNITVKSIGGANGNTATEDPEGDIDIQCVLAVAPLCNLVIYDNAGTGDLISVLTHESQDNLADIVSESYGWMGGASFYLAAHNLHLAMNAQGITYLAASGDTGTDSQKQAPYSDIDPEVCIVGGTTVSVDNLGNRTLETGWTGSGGGWFPSQDPFNIHPSYQKGTGVPTGNPYRLFPDVSLDADPGTGYPIYVQGQLQGWGGTSCAAPAMAGALADAEQQIIASGGLPKDSNGNRRFGRIQDLIYSLNGDSNVFFDITAGSNGTLPSGASSKATAGWDTVTGWGPMIFSGLVSKVLDTAVLSNISVQPQSLVGGTNAVGTINLTSSAPVGGFTVTLKSNSAAVVVPATVTIDAGKATTTFSVTTKTQTSQVSATITAAAKGISVTTTMAINPSVLSSFTLQPGTVAGGVASTATVALNGPAPAGGAVAKLLSSTTSATVPATVTIPAGSTSTTFKVTTKAVSSQTPATLSAQIGTATVYSTLVINPPTIALLTFTPASAIGGKTAVSGIVTLTGAASATGATITLTNSSSSIATIPATVKIAGGALTGKFSVTTKAVVSESVVKISAAFANSSAASTFSLLPPVLTAVKVAPVSVKGSAATVVTGTVTIGSVAPIGGLVISLSSSNADLVGVPSTVTIPAGKLTTTFKVTHRGVSTKTAFTIGAMFGQVSKQATLTLTP